MFVQPLWQQGHIGDNGHVFAMDISSQMLSIANKEHKEHFL
jgi:ubiquinone/menaquinone biosynthesis C-methylase UbiE